MKSDGDSADCSFSFRGDGLRQTEGLRCQRASVLKHDPKAWEEGFRAGESAARIPFRCPYPAGTIAAWSWHSGYVEDDAKRQGYSYSRGALSKEPPSDGFIA